MNTQPAPIRGSTRRHFTCALFGLVLLLLNPGCARKQNLAAVGKWETENGKESLEFRDDGTLAGRDRYGRPVTGKYEFISADRVRLQMTTSSFDPVSGNRMVDNASGTCKVVVDGDALTVIEDGRSETHYRRMK